jgi:hypothetical protein
VWQNEVILDDISDGLQFPPQTADGDIEAFDNIYQRPFTYTKTGTVQIDGPSGKITTQVFNEKHLASGKGDDLTTTFPGTLSVGPAFNLDLVVAKRGCISCDPALTSKITVD